MTDTPADPPAATAKLTGDQIVAACQANFPAHSTDCSGFARAVAAALHVPLSGLANDIVGTIQGGGGWKVLPDGPTGTAQAAAGNFVIGGLMGSEQASPAAHGHVVVVVPGALNRGVYPTAYWGMLGGVGMQNQTINYAWSASDRDKVHYAAYTTADVPVGSLPPPAMDAPALPATAPPDASGKPQSFASANGVSTVTSGGVTQTPSKPAVVESADSPSTGDFKPEGDISSGLPETRIGDSMTHGAKIITGSPNHTDNGIPVVRIGDMVACPIKGHGVNPIVSGCSANVTDNGVFVSRIGATSACGAMVIAGSPNVQVS